MADKKLLNRTARSYNVKLIVKGKRFNVTILPGLNMVDSKLHSALKKVKYVKALVDEDYLDFNPKVVKPDVPKNNAKVKEVADPQKPLGGANKDDPDDPDGEDDDDDEDEEDEEDDEDE